MKMKPDIFCHHYVKADFGPLKIEIHSTILDLFFIFTQFNSLEMIALFLASLESFNSRER